MGSGVGGEGIFVLDDCDSVDYSVDIEKSGKPVSSNPSCSSLLEIV